MKRKLKKTLRMRADEAEMDYLNDGPRTVSDVWIAGYRAGRVDASKMDQPFRHQYVKERRAHERRVKEDGKA